MSEQWIAKRMHSIEMSGIRKVFELARDLKNPINLSIGQPHFPVPTAIKEAAKAAIDRDLNGYTLTQGIPELRSKISEDLQRRLPGQDRAVMITSGTSGALFLAMTIVIDPGDEVILFDPYFVSYPHLVTMSGGVPVILDTYPDFQIDVNRVAAAITPRTKAIVFSSPANPTGVVIPPETLRDLAHLARDRNVLLISDEIYRTFHYDTPFRSAAEFDSQVLCVDGFGKSYGITGWRLGFAHGPKVLIEEMNKLQQFTYVCAPAPAQYAGLAAWDFATDEIVAQYRIKRDLAVAMLQNHFEIAPTGGAFYLFPKAPWGTGSEFVRAAIRESLLIIPGSVFGRRDTHFRMSYAVENSVLQRGLELLVKLAEMNPRVV